MKVKISNIDRKVVLFVLLAITVSFVAIFGYIGKQGFLVHFSVCLMGSMCAVLAITPFVKLIANKTNVVDTPSPRKIHNAPVPLLGGVSVYLCFLAVNLFAGPLTREMKSILIGGTIVFVLGTIDDIRPLGSVVRLGGQLAASAIVMSSGLIVSFLPATWWGWAMSVLITATWILGIVNALNFSDGMDGLAAGITAITAYFFFLISARLGNHEVAQAAIILAGCSTGFLFFNFKPARIYLGDGGSTFIGFLLACLALYGGWSNKGPVIALGIPVLILGVLIFDMCYITVSRVGQGVVRTVREWLDYVGKDHFHHRLMYLGFTEPESVVFIYTTCVILGLSALVLENTQNYFYVVILIFQAFLVLINITVLMIAGRNISVLMVAGRNFADFTESKLKLSEIPHSDRILKDLEEKGKVSGTSREGGNISNRG